MITIRNFKILQHLKKNQEPKDIISFGNDNSELLEKLKNTTNINQVYDYLEKCINKQHPTVRQLDSNIFQYKDYFIRLGKSFNTDSLVQTLKDIDDLNLSCAPKYIESKYFKGGDTMLITQIKTYNSDLPIQNYTSVQQEVPILSKNLFLQDIDKLLKKDIINPAIIDSTQNWFVIPKSNRIYIDNWDTLNPVYTSKEKLQLKKEITDMCGLIY